MGATDRIKEYLGYKGITKYKFYKKTGFSNKFLDNSSNMGTDRAEIILHHYPDLNPNWLLTGAGSMLKDETIASTGVPLVEPEAVGGFGNATFSINPTDILERYAVPDFHEASFLIRVRGNSMAPRYCQGDMVACKIIRESQFIQWNEIYVIATTEQGILIKRIRESGTKEAFLAVSENPDYAPFEIPVNEITGIALVLGGISLE